MAIISQEQGVAQAADQSKGTGAKPGPKPRPDGFFSDPMSACQGDAFLGEPKSTVLRWRQAGVLKGAEGKDYLGRPQTSMFTQASLLKVGPCMQTARQLRETGVAESIDDHLWVMKKTAKSFARKDLAIKSKLLTLTAAWDAIIKEKKRDDIPHRRFLSAIDSGELPSIEIAGYYGAVLTQSDLNWFLSIQTPAEFIDRNKFKTYEEVYEEIAKLHPESCKEDDDGKLMLKDGKRILRVGVKREISECANHWSKQSYRGDLDENGPRLLEMREAKIETTHKVAASFAKRPNGQKYYSEFKTIKELNDHKLIDWPKFRKLFEQDLDGYVKKAIKFAAEGGDLHAKLAELRVGGIVGRRLCDVLKLAGLAAKYQKKGVAKPWLRKKLSAGAVLLNVIKRDVRKTEDAGGLGRESDNGLRTAFEKLGLERDEICIPITSAGRCVLPRVCRYVFWRLPEHPKLTDAEKTRAIAVYHASEKAAEEKPHGVGAAPSAATPEANVPGDAGTVNDHASAPPAGPCRQPATPDPWKGKCPVVSVCIIKGRSNHHAFKVNGKVKQLLMSRAEVILALIEAGPIGLDKNDLETKGRPGARRTLRQLRESSADWRAVIRFPSEDNKPNYRLI